MKTIPIIALLCAFAVAVAHADPASSSTSPDPARAEWLKDKAGVERELKESELELAKLCSSLLPKLSDAQAAAFKRAQIRWAEFRNVEAVFRAHDYAMGQVESTEAFQSLVTAFKYYITADRVKSLQPTLAVH